MGSNGTRMGDNYSETIPPMYVRILLIVENDIVMHCCNKVLSLFLQLLSSKEASAGAVKT